MTEKQIVDKVVDLLGERLEQMINERLGSPPQEDNTPSAPAIKAPAAKKATKASAKKATGKKTATKKKTTKKAATKKKTTKKK